MGDKFFEEFWKSEGYEKPKDVQMPVNPLQVNLLFQEKYKVLFKEENMGINGISGFVPLRSDSRLC